MNAATQAYEVEVATADLTFRVARRFSEFHALFKRVRRATTLKCDFPKRVLNPFVSSTHRAVVEERASKLHSTALNNTVFLRELLDRVRISKDATVAEALFAFLGLRGRHGITKNITNKNG